MALVAGNIAFVGFNADGNDNIAFVALVDISAGETIIFEDNEWNGTSWVDTNEGAFSWTATSTVSAGTIVRIDNIGAGTIAASTGTAVSANALSPSRGTNRGLGASDETLYAYQGTAAAPIFITAIASGGFNATNGLLTNTGLTVGVNAIDLSTLDDDADIAAFNASRSGQVNFASYLPIINNSANWIAQDATGDQSIDSTAPDVPFSATAFTINPPAISSIDLSNYVRVGLFNLPVGTGSNLLATEVSAVTYNKDTDTLFVVGDGGTAIVQVSKTGQLIDSMTLTAGLFADPEGLTYIGNGQFVIADERVRQASVFTYAKDTTLTANDIKTVKLGTTIGNIGIEGITFDPLTNGFIAVKEENPLGIFQTTIDFTALTASNGSPTTVNSTDLFNPSLTGLADFADVFAFSTLAPTSDRLLILSQASGKIVNSDRSGNISSSLTIVSDPSNPLSVADQQFEGLTVDTNGILYVTSENGATPQLSVYAPSQVPNAAPTALVLNNQVNAIAENTSTTNPLKVADISITDDGLGTNTLSLSGTDANFFTISGNALFIKAGTNLDFETKTSYNVTVNVDDPTIGSNPDASAAFSLAVTDIVNETPAPPNLGIKISAIQGAGHISPLVGQVVTAVAGIVTAVDSNGFYFQDPNPDADIATSEGIFVFTNSAPTVKVGDSITVTGTVSEFTPGGTSTGNLSTTQIGGTPTIAVLSNNNPLPSATIIGAGGRVPPNQIIDNDGLTSFDPNTDGIDFFESLEGMRVMAKNLLAVSPTNSFGEIYAVVDNGAGATGLSQRGTINIAPDDFNPERIQIDADNGVFDFAFPNVNVGAKLGDVTGVVGYNFGNFEIIPTEAFVQNIQPSTLQPEVTTLGKASDTLLIATYNVLNLDPQLETGVAAANIDDDIANGRFAAIANQIVNNMGTPDIIGLQEIQDNSGAQNDGVTSASVTLQTLVNAIAAAGGPTYKFIDNTFITNNASGGQPGANIRTAFLYNSDRVDLVAGSVKTVPSSSLAAFADTRLPLIADFSFNGETVTVITNHFSSKGGSRPLFGTTQPSVGGEANGNGQENVAINGSLDQRRAQAQAVNDYVDSILATKLDAKVVVVGDFNEFEFISPLNILAGGANPVLTNLTNSLPENERYTFNFDGNSQSLDHILVSNNLTSTAKVDIVHVNTEFVANAQRASDHDPIVATIKLAPTAPTLTPLGTTENDVLDALPNQPFDGFKDILFTGSGNDKVDLGFVASFANAGDNRIDLGSGGDQIFVNQNDVIFGGSGNDEFFAQDSKGGNRMSGGAGNDIFYLGAGDRALGGDGNDQFFVSTGGNNLLSGGAGADQFWIFNASAPSSANTIVDFQIGTDVIGISGAGAGFGFANLTLAGNTIAIAGNAIATLTNVDATSLTSASFVFSL